MACAIELRFQGEMIREILATCLGRRTFGMERRPALGQAASGATRGEWSFGLESLADETEFGVRDKVPAPLGKRAKILGSHSLNLGLAGCSSNSG